MEKQSKAEQTLRDINAVAQRAVGFDDGHPGLNSVADLLSKAVDDLDDKVTPEAPKRARVELRLPSSLHQRLAAHAARRAQSLNDYMTEHLQAAIGEEVGTVMTSERTFRAFAYYRGGTALRGYKIERYFGGAVCAQHHFHAEEAFKEKIVELIRHGETQLGEIDYVDPTIGPPVEPNKNAYQAVSSALIKR